MAFSRVLASAALASLLLASAGTLWYGVRFDWSLSPVGRPFEQEITMRIAARARMVEAAAERAARAAPLVEDVLSSPRELPELFARLNEPRAAVGEATLTLWIPDGIGGYRPLAWTDGPADAVPADDLARAPAFVTAVGAAGLRLVALRPIVEDGLPLGVATAEVLLGIVDPSDGTIRFPTTAGDVRLVPVGAPAADSPVDATRFRVGWGDQDHLLDVEYTPAQVAQAAATFRWRVVVIAVLPWIAVWIALLVRLGRRRAAEPAAWWGWSALMTAVLALGALPLVWIAARASVADIWLDLVWVSVLTAFVVFVPVARWWRPIARRRYRLAPVRGTLEHLAAGVLMAVAVLATAWLWRDAAPETIPTAARLLLAQVSMVWIVAAGVAILAVRWRVTWMHPIGWIAAAWWAAPSLALPFVVRDWLPGTFAVAALLPAGLIAFGLASTSLRRVYHLSGEGGRLLLNLAGGIVPILLAYPLAAAAIEQTVRQSIEEEYAPAAAAARQPASLMALLTAAQAELDALPDLADLANPDSGDAANGGTSRAAFRAWHATILSRARVTSELELYGADRHVTSRFSLNFPEFSLVTPDTDQVWTGESCAWEAFAEVARLGAGERSLLHAERGLCAPDGRLLGAVVLHIAPDYLALPFVTSANPYYDALSAEPQTRNLRTPDIFLAVYGWSLQPSFVSDRVVWPIDEAIDDRVYASRDPFWVERFAEGRRYHVYFTNDRGGIYAIGYPATLPLEHATRVAEASAIVMALFAIYLAASLLVAPLARPATPPLVRVFREVRASFYRKLFLFFVLAATGPVVLFAIAFGAYMGGKLRDDIEFEAGTVAQTARRVFDEVGALTGPPGQTGAPRDELMVWIRQVIGQDVHLFDGPTLRATSQRDLFDSGLLPVRTPAAVYRDVVIDRRPISVVEDRLGSFTYLVASAPVPALGREAILSVPLAHRQRDVEQQVDDLSRGVLAGMLVVVLFAAALGASVAGKVADPVARLTRATRRVAAGRLNEHVAVDTADELGRLVDDFNTMTDTLAAQRAELARAHQAKAWNEMARQVAHDIKNPLTPVQLAAEHLQRVHDDRGRPLGVVFDRCLATILSQVRLLRRIASEFSTFAGDPSPQFTAVDVAPLVAEVMNPYAGSPPAGVRLERHVPEALPRVRVDRTLIARALTNLVENALQAMPSGGVLTVTATAVDSLVRLELRDTGVGMDAENVRRAFEPYFSTKTAGSGLGLANAKRNVELCGGTLSLSSMPGAGTIVTLTMPVAPRGGAASD